MTCIDCKSDQGKPISCIYDHRFLGEVCPKCERVFSPVEPAGNKRYTTKTAAMAAMKRDQAQQKLFANHQRALVDRILSDRF